MSGWKCFVRFKPHNLMAFPRCGDEQGMNFFLEPARLHAEFADIAHLRGGGNQVEDLWRNQVVVQYDLGGTKYVHRFDGQEIGITWTGSHQIDFTLHG